jgi:hypothetical protein
MTNVVAVAFTPAPSSDSPNLKASSNARTLETFHNLIELCFASIRRWNPTTTLELVTTSDPGPRLAERLKALDVAIRLTTFAHRPPPGFYPTFNASLFSIDALSALARQYSAEDRIVLLDPDVICTRSIDPLFASIQPTGFVAYDTHFPADHVSQGLSAVDARELHQRLDPSLLAVPRHYGGELYGFRPPSWHSIAEKVDDAWSFSLAQWQRGLPRFVTEEHLLNYALRHTQIRSAEEFIRRIWTAPTHRTVRARDLLLPIWHLPAEKHRGLAQLHKQARTADSWFWQAPATVWQQQAARAFGIPRRRPARWTRDTVAGALRMAQRSNQTTRCVSRLRPAPTRPFGAEKL